MAASIDENTQYTDPTTGELLVNGYIYIGLDGLDAKLNPASIYSDRDLSVALANPQRTGSDGRAVNKIWVSGKYSMKVENSANVQKLNDLSLGDAEVTSNTVLTNIQGTDAVTADGSPTITALVNNQVYIFTAANTNTGAMTLAIDLITAYPIKKQHDQAMVAGDIEQNQTVALIWNSTDSVFELMTNSAIAPVDTTSAQTIGGVKTFSSPIVGDLTGDLTGASSVGGTLTLTKGADIASANDTVLLADGNLNDITGTTTINGMTTPASGSPVRRFHFDGAVLLKHATAPSAGFSQLLMPNSSDYTTASNDVFEFTYNGVYWEVTGYVLATGKSLVETTQTTAANGSSMVLISTQAASASASVEFTSGIDSTYDRYRINFHFRPATDLVNLYIQISEDTGSTYKSANYKYLGLFSDGNTTTASGVRSDSTTVMIAAYDCGIGSTALHTGYVEFSIPDSTTYKKVFQGMTTGTEGGGYQSQWTFSGEYAGTVAAFDAIKFFCSSGNIAAGSFSLYGIKDA